MYRSPTLFRYSTGQVSTTPCCFPVRLLTNTVTLALPKDGSVSEHSTTNVASPVFTNRNPRNLEMMSLAYKRAGWRFQAPRKDFYHKIVVEKKKAVSAKLIHTSGDTIITASTSEAAISQYLPSTTNAHAAYNIGRILAHRCIQAGIECALFDPEGATGEQIEQFKKGLIECGLELSEPEAKPFGPQHIGIYYDKD